MWTERVAMSEVGTEEFVCDSPPSLSPLLPGTIRPQSPSPEGLRGGFLEVWQFHRALFLLPSASHPWSPNLSRHSWDPQPAWMGLVQGPL